MANKTITAFFDDFTAAADAVRRLENAGIRHEDISLIANNEGDRYSDYAGGRRHDLGDRTSEGAGTGATVGTLAGGGAGLLAGLGMLAIPGLGPVVAAGWLVSTLVGAGAGAAVGGLAGSLVGAGVDENDANAYAEGVRRGGALVTVRSSETMVDRIVDILDDDGTVDLDQRTDSWRSANQGRSETGSPRTSSSDFGVAGLGTTDSLTTGGPNTGIGAAASTTTGLNTGMMGAQPMASEETRRRQAGTDFDSSVDPDLGASGTLGARSTASSEGMGKGVGTSTRRSTETGDEVIPVAEEELQVGKREVNRGRVRIHSHVVERPVEEQVNLRQEHVQVERRPVEGSARAAANDSDLFRERTVEMEERSEEPVIGKEARVREELVVRKDVDQKTQTVSDKVRRTEVEVEDERGKRTTGTTDRDRR